MFPYIKLKITKTLISVQVSTDAKIITTHTCHWPLYYLCDTLSLYYMCDTCVLPVRYLTLNGPQVPP